MGIFIVSYMDLAPTLQIMGWCPWWVDVTLNKINLLYTIRCTTHNNNLDGGGGRLSHELTDTLLAVLDPQTLSNDYGIIHDIVVCVYIHASISSLAY